MASIYVSIPSMNDNELIPSLKNCIHRASKKNTINIGVAFSTFYQESYLDYYLQETSKLDSVKFKHFHPEESLGVGAARKNAYSFYDGEDYFLQIDAHSLFKKNWDIELIEKLNHSKNKYGKCILTCYPAPYYYKDEARLLHNGWSTVTTKVHPGVLSDYRFDEGNESFWDFLPNWNSPDRKNFFDDYERILKISAGFMFGDKEFASNYLDLIPYEYMFFEEEIIVTSELLHKGYDLVAPSNIPIAHLYSSDLDSDSMREGMDPKRLYKNEVQIKNNFYNYCYNNKDKINLLNSRLGIDMFKIIEESKKRLLNGN